MHSQLVSGLPIQTFGLCVAIGMYASLVALEKLTRRKDASNLVFVLALAGIAGARAAHVVEYWGPERFSENPWDVFAIWNGGLVFYGGLAAGIVAFLVWCRAVRSPVLTTADALAAVLPLGHAFGRLGCFFHGCCWGRVSDSPLAVTFPAGSPAYWAHPAFPGAPRSLPLLPTQLFEAAALLALFAVLALVFRRFKGWTAPLYCAGYGTMRFFIEFLRDDIRPHALGLSSAQLFSLGLVAAGIALAAVEARARKRAASAPGEAGAK